jgi:hypothetical protein
MPAHFVIATASRRWKATHRCMERHEIKGESSRRTQVQTIDGDTGKLPEIPLTMPNRTKPF